MAEIQCPFCGVSSSDPYALHLHVEESHPETASPITQHGQLASTSKASSVGNGKRNALPGSQWTKCTRSGCGEYILLQEVDEHLDVHAALIASEFEANRSEDNEPTLRYDESTYSNIASEKPRKVQAARELAPTSGRPSTRMLSFLDYFSGNSVPQHPRTDNFRRQSEPGRLGMRELGPHAFEKTMPRDVRQRLVNDALPREVTKLGRNNRLFQETVVENETAHIIPVLARLCAADETNRTSYFCHPSVKHIRKICCDGNFCGYWSIQMLLTFLQYTRSPPHLRRLPNVLQMQDTIELAWNNNICSYSKTETGGIRGTRKWIGTAEAVAYFAQSGIQYHVMGFTDDDDDLAVTALFDYIEAFYIGGIETAKHHGTSHITKLAPIYLQREGHSMVVVGLERKKNGSRNLMVFDSSFATSTPMKKSINGQPTRASPDTMLKAYRRSETTLMRWEEFEVLMPQIYGSWSSHSQVNKESEMV